LRYRVSNIPLWLDEDEALLTRRAAERLGVSAAHLRDVLVIRRSLDARKKGHARWLVNLEVTVEGEEAHGGSPMAGRRDALMAAAPLIAAIERIALGAVSATGEPGRATVGRLTVYPDSRNIAPSRIWFSIDTRHGDPDLLAKMAEQVRAEATAIAAEQPAGGRGAEEEGAEQGELYESLPGFGAPPPQGQQDGEAENATAAAAGEADASKGGRTASATHAPAANGQLAGATVPADIPDARDDDIVARQLREAAQMEKDPKLREKLWDEYRKYKNQQAAQ
jgi:acetylornithine deacetylase/succinyl-diaminopimelate desuccinylase-like protein